MNVRKNDTVMVVSGNSLGKQGKVLKLFPDKGRLIIEGVNTDLGKHDLLANPERVVAAPVERAWAQPAEVAHARKRQREQGHHLGIYYG